MARVSAGKGEPRAVCAWLAIGLVVLTILSYWPVFHCKFLGYDDDEYVTANRRVKAGLTISGLAWAWTKPVSSHWHPLTMVSHMADVELFGMNAAFHHLTALVLHIANTLFLLLFLTRATGKPWASAFAAGLFAVHPLHVESVAWIAERKDVLSTLFWMLTMLAYARYAARPRFRHYLPVFALMALGLTAKSMLVTLPIVLLLLDFWPLGRLAAGPAENAGRERCWRRALVEKLPLLVLSLAFAGATWFVMAQSKMVAGLGWTPLGVRLANAAVTYITYLWQTVYPARLAAFYPHPQASLPTWTVALSAAGLAAITVGAIRTRKSRPYLLTGWLWYLVTLTPVIGVLQVGMQARADRYTYVPLIGIFITIAWRAAEFAQRRPALRPALAAPGVTVLLGLAVVTNAQVRYWRNDYTLFGHALSVTRDNWFAHNNFGVALKEQGRQDLAFYHYKKAVQLNPLCAKARFNLAGVLAERNQNAEAELHYRKGLEIEPDEPRARLWLGVVLSRMGRTREALEQYRMAIKLDPGNPLAWFDLGTLESRLGRYEDALRSLGRAIELKPSYAEALVARGAALVQLNRYAEAIRDFEKAVRAKPGCTDAMRNLAVTHFICGRYAKAWKAVHDCRASGGALPPGLVQALSQKMREPAR